MHIAFSRRIPSAQLATGKRQATNKKSSSANPCIGSAVTGVIAVSGPNLTGVKAIASQACIQAD
jgi:hypothetical protein